MGLSTEDRLAIQALYARYNSTLDFGDAEGYAACFTPDGVFVRPHDSVTGTEMLAQIVRDMEKARGRTSRHWLNNLLVQETDGGASGTCYIMVLRVADGEGSRPVITGVFRDRLVKGAGGWRFSERRFTADA